MLVVLQYLEKFIDTQGYVGEFKSTLWISTPLSKGKKSLLQFINYFLEINANKERMTDK